MVGVVWSKYPNAMLYHRLRFYHDARFTLNFITFWSILITNVRRLGKGETRYGLEETARVNH
jgi:hypothetical protein